MAKCRRCKTSERMPLSPYCGACDEAVEEMENSKLILRKRGRKKDHRSSSRRIDQTNQKALAHSAAVCMVNEYLAKKKPVSNCSAIAYHGNQCRARAGSDGLCFAHRGNCVDPGVHSQSDLLLEVPLGE